MQQRHECSVVCVKELFAAEGVRVHVVSALPDVLERCWRKHLCTTRMNAVHGCQVVLEILNARLLDIREWWDAGALTQRGFTAAEVGRLVRSPLPALVSIETCSDARAGVHTRR